MGNANAKRQREQGVGIQKRMEEEEKKSKKTATVLIMGQGTVNFLNALQCIRDGGLDDIIQSQCKAYIWHQMIFEMKPIIKKAIDGKEWSSNLFQHCVTDQLLIYGFIKSFMVYDKVKRKYSIANKQVIWNQNINHSSLSYKNSMNNNKNGTTDYLISGGLLGSIKDNPSNSSISATNALLLTNSSTSSAEEKGQGQGVNNGSDHHQTQRVKINVDDIERKENEDQYTNYDERVYVSHTCMTIILRYYQSPDTIQNWLNILLFSRSTISSSTSAIINHYILDHVDIGSFINDMFNEFNDEQQNKLLISYDIGASHFFKHLNRITHKSYVPTSKDIILMSTSIGYSLNNNRSKRRYSKTTHVANNQNELKDLRFKSAVYHFTNIQPMFRTQVKRWIYQFEDKCDGLIFLIPLETYYKWDTAWDSFNLIKNFTTITNNNYLKQSSFHLFLTGKEIFKKKLKQQQFKFAEYDGDNSYDSCIGYLIEYLKSKLIADNKGDKRQMYIHVVSLFHLEGLKASFSEVCTNINRNNIKQQHHQQMSSTKFEL
mmetsp:Transcript_52448/g.47087  ORF Transcript_52448/g.47087 Transcript_52448/m.47087 type:complete len:544 (+) Transcript_52448:90-1721(+)